MQLKLLALLLVTSLFLAKANSFPLEAKSTYANEFLQRTGENGTSLSYNVQTEALFTSTLSKGEDEQNKIHDNSKKGGGGGGGGGRGRGGGSFGGGRFAGGGPSRLTNHPTKAKNGASTRSRSLTFVTPLCLACAYFASIA